MGRISRDCVLGDLVKEEVEYKDPPKFIDGCNRRDWAIHRHCWMPHFFFYKGYAHGRLYLYRRIRDLGIKSSVDISGGESVFRPVAPAADSHF